jgi:hypothetical protein
MGKDGVPLVDVQTKVPHDRLPPCLDGADRVYLSSWRVSWHHLTDPQLSSLAVISIPFREPVVMVLRSKLRRTKFARHFCQCRATIGVPVEVSSG